MNLPDVEELAVSSLGSPTVRSPLHARGELFTEEASRVLVSSNLAELPTAPGAPVPAFEPAGPRAKLYFDPSATSCGIVTCGGMCPGTNDVIRSLVMTLRYSYGVERVLGFRYGFAALTPQAPTEPLVLTPDLVQDTHHLGGTILGTSRGPQDVGVMVESLVSHGIDLLFAIGGDGTLRGASDLAGEIGRRGLPIGVIGVPKTIDNDLQWVERSFGFQTAVEEARRVIRAAHCEARGVRNGVGLVKLMGRDSGFIASHATLSNSDVNFCLLGEAPFALDGPHGFLAALQARLALKHHALVVVAEGACQDIMRDGGVDERDASGNVLLRDVGPYLIERIHEHFGAQDIEVAMKYIDPSYAIRGLPANALDAELCLVMGQHAVHAGLAGRTDMMVGSWNQRFTHVPLAMATHGRRRVNTSGRLWQRVLDATGQPRKIFAGAPH